MGVFGHDAEDRDGGLTTNNIIQGSLFTANGTGNLSKMTVKLFQFPAATGLVKCAIYLYDAGGTHDLVAETEEINLLIAEDYSWYDFNFASGSVTNGTQYFLVCMADYVGLAFGPSVGTTETPGITNLYLGFGVAYDGFPDPLTTGADWRLNVLEREINIYCTYTESSTSQDMTLTGNRTWL